jgi:hypothetical protein
MAVLAFCLQGNPAFSQTPGGRTALAAKQRLKNEVVAAMGDGKITPIERAEILAEAKGVVTVKEYEGLVATMDRLSPPEKATTVAKRSANQRAMVAATQNNATELPILGRMLSHVPYIDDLSSGPHPQPSNFAASLPYAKTRDIDFSAAKQTLAKAPRLRDTYVERPTVDRPVPKISRVDKTPASNRTPAKPVMSRRNQIIEKPTFSKYADESILPLPQKNNTSEPNVVQQPSKVEEEMGPLAGSPSYDNPPSGLTMPAGALLPDRSVPSMSAEYAQPVQPKGVEEEFLR